MSELDLPPTQEDLEGDGDLDEGIVAEKPPGVVGRIVEPDEGAAPDDEASVVADETDDATQLSAEEAAMHVIEE